MNFLLVAILDLILFLWLCHAKARLPNRGRIPMCSLFSTTWCIKTEIWNWLRFWSHFRIIFKEDKTSQTWMFYRNKDWEKLAKPQPSYLHWIIPIHFTSFQTHKNILNHHQNKSSRSKMKGCMWYNFSLPRSRENKSNRRDLWIICLNSLFTFCPLYVN